MEEITYKAVVVAKEIILQDLEIARKANDKEWINELLDNLNALNAYLLQNAN